jgi:ubiquinone/menaquinone biosynthesis C-methylase UbiE
VTNTILPDQARHFDSRSPFTPAPMTVRAHGFELPYILKDVMISQAIGRMPPLAGTRVLDVGCGKGIMLDRLSSSFKTEGFGVDVSNESLKGARSESLHVPRVAVAAGEDLPFPDDCFDLAVSFDVLEHVPVPEAVFAEMVRVLRPGGSILCYAVSGKNAFTLNWFLAQGLDLLGVDHWSRSAHSPDRLVDPDRARAQLERQGCTIELFHPFHAFFTILFDQTILVLYWLAKRLQSPRRSEESDGPSRPWLLNLVSKMCVRLLGPLERLDTPWVSRGLSNGFLICAKKPG